MGSKHPGHLGRPGREMWTEAWSMLQELFDGVVDPDEAFCAANLLFGSSVRLPRADLLRRLVRSDPARRRHRRRGVLHRQRDHRPGARRAPGPHPELLGALLADPVDQADLGARVAEVLGRNAA